MSTQPFPSEHSAQTEADDTAPRMGARLRDVMEQKKLSQTQLAHIIKCHPTRMGQYLRGEASPDATQLRDLAQALNFSVDWLLFGDKYQRDPETRIEIGDLRKQLFEHLNVTLVGGKLEDGVEVIAPMPYSAVKQILVTPAQTLATIEEHLSALVRQEAFGHEVEAWTLLAAGCDAMSKNDAAGLDEAKELARAARDARVKARVATEDPTLSYGLSPWRAVFEQDANGGWVAASAFYGAAVWRPDVGHFVGVVPVDQPTSGQIWSQNDRFKVTALPTTAPQPTQERAEALASATNHQVRAKIGFSPFRAVFEQDEAGAPKRNVTPTESDASGAFDGSAGEFGQAWKNDLRQKDRARYNSMKQDGTLEHEAARIEAEGQEELKARLDRDWERHLLQLKRHHAAEVLEMLF